ncbi:sensor histidine kinase [Paenibacillus yanchengensis]|uniref:Heme sensor protein HssS n=1 Tax=Paenibacillus yanchengensis TaxID=2035833 RepID=A0ABW4YJC1_9BACL
MIKSLYLRVVLTYLLSIIGGTIIALFVVTLFFQDKANENVKIPLLHFGQDILRIYEMFPLDEADAYVRGMKQLDSYHIRIFDESGQFKAFGTLDGHKRFAVTVEQLKKVLQGEVVQDSSVGTAVATNLIGLPLTTEIGTKALFVETLIPPSISLNRKLIFSLLSYSLIAGSLLILFAAMFLVRPIKKLTKATRRVATGDFNVKLKINQTDELGTLARSFEEMMQDLQQLEQMRRDFVSNVSHEVQSPLTSISGYAIALKQVGIPDSERNRYLDIIIAEAGRMSKMSDSLLKLSVLESHSQKLRLTTFSLDEQIRVVIVALQPQWSARNIHFELNLKPLDLLADYDLLNQVWTNLLSNGIKFSKDSSEIQVSIKQEMNNVIVTISDSGIGISLEDQKRIFERFFKADRSHSRKYDGSGMGLAIVKQIVSLHQGDISVESELEGRTTFIVTLPITMPTE